MARLSISFQTVAHLPGLARHSLVGHPLKASEFFEGDKGNALDEFMQLVDSSLHRETFCGISLSSRRAPLSTSRIDIDQMRGALVNGEADHKPHSQRMKKANSKSSGVLIADDLIRVDGRLVALKAGLHLHMNAKYKTNDQAKNLPIGDNTVTNELRRLIKLGSFKRVELLTETANYELTISKTAKTLKVKSASNVVPDLSEVTHDRKKNLPIDPGAHFLQALNVVNAKGRPLSGMKDKLRQIEKFVEILSGLVERSIRQRRIQNSLGTLSITDMGSGLAYLTFASHAYFSERSHSGSSNTSKRPVFKNVQTLGIENRLSLVQKTNRIARELGPEFDGLSFQHASIEHLHLLDKQHQHQEQEQEQEQGGINVLMALHACDTATDDAIYQGIRAHADVIVTAPCCHKQVRPQLDDLVTHQSVLERSSAMLNYGIYRERISEIVTDTIRAKCLEERGYEVTVAEFVGGEHTAKNVLIAAVKRAKRSQSDVEKIDAREDIKEIAMIHQIHSHKLVSLLGMQDLLVTPTARDRRVRHGKLLPRAGKSRNPPQVE